LCISLLIGSAIYLLSESKQEDSTHEIYNLGRIIHFLQEQRKTIHDDAFLKKSFEQLKETLITAETNADLKMKSKRQKKAGEKYTEFKGLWVDKEQLTSWQAQLGK
jgi:hypothetical protein